jgi:predicted acyl esterase
MRSSLRPLAAAAALLALGAAPAADAASKKTLRALKSDGPPIDYTANPGVSQPKFDDIERTVVKLPAFDGKQLYIEVTKPKGADNLPVVLESSPYHGTLADREGTRILPEPRGEDGKSLGLTGFFAPRGYAVVMMDLRGTGRSQGCLDHLGPKDARDIEQVVEWAASQDWSNGKVGMTGHSYVGSTPSVAAAQRPKGLATIVPSAGLASMYDHQFQGGVPFYLQFAGPIEAYEQLAIQRKLPFTPPGVGGTTGQFGDDFGNNMEETGCGLPNSAAVAGEDQLSGRYSDWHVVRDHSKGATKADIPVFNVHGVNDNAARITAADWFIDRDARKGDKLWLGQWDHGSGCCPTRRGIQWPMALLAWFDKHLKGKDVDTGPDVEVFLADGATFSEARTGARSHVLTAKGYPKKAAETLTFFPSADGKLGTTAPAAGQKSFQGTPQGFVSTTDGANFVSEPLEQDTVLMGMPKMNLAASVTAPRVHLIGTLYDVRPDGNRRRITQCSINPELRNGIATRTLVVPATRYEMSPPCMQMGHRIPAGHKVALRISTADADKVPTFAVDPNVTVFTGGDKGTSITVPVVPSPKVYEDTVNLEPEE